MASVIAIFRIIAPDFRDIDNDTVNAWISLTDPFVSSRMFGKFHDQALAWLTAHRMYLAGVGGGDEALADEYGLGNLAAGKMRHISSYTEGKVSISFNHEQGDLDTESDAYYGLSKFGLEFLKIRDSVIVPISSSAMRRW